MNIIDRNFYKMVQEIQQLSERELYHRMRKSFDSVPEATQKSCMDFFNQFRFWGQLDPQRGIYEEIELKQSTLSHHMEDFIWLYERLEDYRSKKTLYAILSNWYRYDFAATVQTREYLFDSYFDLDLLSCGPEEVFVDLGAYVGDTVLSYLQNYGTDCYRKIYCYEITPDIFQQLKKNLSGYPNIELRQKGVGNGQGSMYVHAHEVSASANTLVADTGGTQVPITTLDADIREPVTLIKADIEGFEQEALLGARGHIVNEHPRLLISVYHGNDDLWQIPRLIHSFSSDYRFYLRYLSSPIYPTEITLFAL